MCAVARRLWVQPLRVARCDREYGKLYEVSSFLKALTQEEEDMSKEPSGVQKNIGHFAPKLAQLTDDVLFGDIWERAELSKRDRSLITVSALVAGGNTEQLRFHLKRAKDNGSRYLLKRLLPPHFMN